MQFDCPECGKEVGAILSAKLEKETTFSFVIEPKPGSSLAARTLGESILNMDKLMRCVAKDLGAKAICNIKEIGMTDTGGLRVTFMILHVSLFKEPKPKQETLL